jgi:hypothetical protein
MFIMLLLLPCTHSVVLLLHVNVVFSTHCDIMFSIISFITRLIFRIINFQIEIGKKEIFY